jgi:7-cyano-7-deazaguanine synthase
MCAIFGALLFPLIGNTVQEANNVMNYICHESVERGRDGFGFNIWEGDFHHTYKSTKKRDKGSYVDMEFFWGANNDCSSIIGNLRAEPTTEFVLSKIKEDQQPYSVLDWTVVHNGTIANDRELRTMEVPTAIDSAAIPELLGGDNGYHSFHSKIELLKGSYAILAHNKQDKDTIYLACNYRPIWYIKTEYGMFFASARDYFPSEYTPQMMEPYSTASFTIANGEILQQRAT